MSASPCPEDLLILERRGTLGSDEQRALAEHAATCELCSLSRALGRDLARDPLPALAGEATGSETDIDRNEQTRLALIVARTMLMRGKVVRSGSPAPAEVALVPLPSRRAAVSRPKTRRRRRARSPRRFAVAAALLLLAGSASAAWWRWSAWTTEQARIKERAAPAAVRSSGLRRRVGSAGVVMPPEDLPAPSEQPPAIDELHEPVARSEQPFVAPPPDPVRVAPSPVPPPAARPRVAALPAGPRVPDLDAHQLFVAAGQARRARAFAEAAGLYRALQAHFPGSAEATLSFLSLGDLLLSQGALAQALAQFDAYLASGDTMMAEEALVGRARTLARLGRTEGERAAWRALLARFPQSDYRWRAQQRLDGAGAVDTP